MAYVVLPLHGRELFLLENTRAEEQAASVSSVGCPVTSHRHTAALLARSEETDAESPIHHVTSMDLFYLCNILSNYLLYAVKTLWMYCIHFLFHLGRCSCLASS